MFERWLRALTPWHRPRQPRATSRRPARTRVALEELETRVVPSHYRYGNLSWEPVSGNTVRFNYQQAWRLNSLSGVNAVGNVVSNFDSLLFGDGTSTQIFLKVLSVNVAENWLVAEAGTGSTPATFTPGFTHAYPNSGPFTVSMESCCRISTLRNNRDGQYRNETIVRPGTGNASPVSSLPPIVQVADNTTVSFQIPGFDPNNDAITYRLSTSAETGGFGSFIQPTGLAVSPTGVVTWNLLNAGGVATNIGDLWSTQVMLEDHSGGAAGPVKSKVPLDFILQVVGTTNQPPTIVANPAGPFQPLAGQELTFAVTASDPDGTIANLQALNAPAGMTLSPFAPGGTSSRTVTWTPTPAQANQTFVVTFQATDNQGATANTTVTISPAANGPPTADAGGPYLVVEGGSVPLAGSGSDPESGPLTFAWDLDEDSVFETTGPSPTFSATGLDGRLGAHRHVMLRVTDNAGNSAFSEAMVLIQNAPPAAADDSVATDEDTPAAVDVPAPPGRPTR
jgi:hypothetical protein